MDYDAFISVIQDALGSDRETAERAARAVLSVLGKRLGTDEARVFVSHLPPEVGGWLHTSGGAQSFDAEEFVRRVAEQEDTDPGTAERHVIFVLAALARALPDREYEHMVARLSKDYAPLLPKAATPPVLSTRAFLDRIGQRAGVDASAAPRVAEAVLETLAERITDGEALDLTTRLPVRFHGAIKRGAVRGDATTRKMAPDEFLRRVAQRAGVDEERARDYARAVLATVREATRDEFLDVTVQLPAGYRDLLGVG
ncbi:MAG TPA: DUF2267 domain-containing protein [Actinoplanes sp.]|jgi:uncharacterized protein (DUF2267 family)